MNEKEIRAAIDLYDLGQVKAEDAIEHIRSQLQTTSTMPKLPAQEDVLAYAERITHSDYWPLVRTKVASVYLYIKGQLSA